jgi:hypothetical protein
MARLDDNADGTSAPEEEQKAPTTVRSIAELVNKAIQDFAGKFEVKTVAEWIRLVEFQKQMGQDEPKEIRATWIEPSQKPTDQ